jgi:hypothetical protein
MTVAEYLGFIGWAWIFYGMWEVGRKRRSGFLIATLGGLFITAQAIMTPIWSLLVANTLFQALYVRNFIKWGKRNG